MTDALQKFASFRLFDFATVFIDVSNRRLVHICHGDPRTSQMCLNFEREPASLLID